MKPHHFWKLSELKEAALPYQHRAQFRAGNVNAYRASMYHGLLDQVCAHMTCNRYRMPPKWTLELLVTEAKKYTTRWGFCEGSHNAYRSAARRGLLDQVCAHMGGKNEQVR